ncbi:MAG: 2-oxoacid:acceptor oxidoreductase family protein [Candidatus Magasanikbacteria bacterium]|jgi:2-oxoglutarate ferredoxin oxidoreductase subunit gamma
MILKILIAGDGGQGVQTIADLICKTAFKKDYQVSHIPNYGLEQRGGVSLAFIQISDEKIGYPKFSTPDVLVVMSDQARERAKQYLGSGILLDVSDFKSEIENKKINPQNLNIFFLTLLAKILEEKNIVSTKDLYTTLEDKLGKKSNWEEIKNILK